jgi:hypothetical protein
MEKTCANHPESLALATCKACEKSVCLMCVQDEKEGTFCSSKCVQVFREVTDWVDTNPKAPAAPVAEEPAPPAPTAPSIFDSEPAPATAQAEFEPLVTPGTKWKMIGSVCANHTDTPAVATCDRCDKTLCAMCLMETSAGTFCSQECAGVAEPVPLPQVPPAPPSPPVPVSRAPVRRSGSRSKSPKVAILVGALAVLGVGGYFVVSGLGSPESKPPNPPPVQPPVQPLAKKDPVTLDPVKVDPVTKVDPKIDPKIEPKVDPKTEPNPEPARDPKTEPKSDPATAPKTRPKTVKPEPPPPMRIDCPWLRETAGIWYRIRTTIGEQETYLDCGLKAKEASRYILVQQISRQGQPQALQEVTLDVIPYIFRGEETLSIEGRPYLCEIREWSLESGAVRQWVLIEGRHYGAILKTVSPGGAVIPRRLWEHTIKVKARKFDCLVVEGDAEVGGKHIPTKSWYCPSFPMGALRVETSDRSITLLDTGDDWSKRPPFPK